MAAHAIAFAAKPIRTTTEVADRYRARLARAFTRMMTALSASVKSTDRPDAIPDRVAGLFNGSGLQPNQRSFADEFAIVFEAGAEAGMRRLDRVAVPKSVATAMTFTLLNPSAVSFLQGYGFELITSLTLGARQTIAAIVTNAFTDGTPPKAQARQIREYIGLTPAQYQAVRNYRRMLESGDPGLLRDSLSRQLRDARFDSTIERAIVNGTRLTRQQIERLVSRYAERQLKYRAEMIARTETIRAANAGQVEAWNQAQQQGLLSATVRQKWIYTRDERTCTICPRIPGMNPEGVPIGGLFQSPVGLIRQPPDPHPQCRCSLGLVNVG